MTGGWMAVESAHGAAVHWAPVVPAEEWMVDRVTLCWPRGQRKAWFQEVDKPVTCIPCLALKGVAP